MTKIVVDVALLFPANLEKKLIKINHSLKRDYSPAKIYLNEENCFPHISLLMGVIDESQLEGIAKKLDYLASKFNPPKLNINNIELETLPTKDKEVYISGISLKKNSLILELHRSVVENLKEFLSEGEINERMMYASIEIDAKDTPWMFQYIQNFLKNSSYEKFNPHITIGDGVLKKQRGTPKGLTASRIAICQLGNYCTCRKILYEKNFREE